MDENGRDLISVLKFTTLILRVCIFAISCCGLDRVNYVETRSIMQKQQQRWNKWARPFNAFSPGWAKKKNNLTYYSHSLSCLYFLRCCTSENLEAAMEQMGKSFQCFHPRLGEEKNNLKYFSHSLLCLYFLRF